MKRLLDTFNSLVKDRHKIKIEDFDGKYSTIRDKVSSIIKRYPANTFIPIFQIANEISEDKLQSECVSYDIDFILQSNIIEKYKHKVAELETSNAYLCSDELDKLSLEMTTELLASGNKLAKIIDSGTRGNPSNIFRSFISDGYKVDRTSSISEFIEESLLEGYQTIEHEYKSSQTARNALIINQGSVSASGYLARRANYITKYIEFDHTECDSQNCLTIELNSKTRKRYEGRYLKCDNLEDLEMIDNNTKDGTYEIYSPLFCTSGSKRVCPKCYGENYLTVHGYKNVGIVSSTALTERLTQSLNLMGQLI